MLTYLTATELIDFIYQSIKEFTVVAHDDSCTIKSLDSFLEHIL